MTKEYIQIKGAREHNLKNIDLKIPRDSLVVVTGVSGSGKSSLAFDTIYAEGQRKYVESLSAYARQFLEQLEKPDIDHIEGLSPAISISQRNNSSNPRSTVGTVTEIYDYLRLLYARVGDAYCYKCGKSLKKQGAEEIVHQILSMPDKTQILILAPVVRGRKGQYYSLFEEIRKQGFVRVRVDNEIFDIDDEIKIAKTKRHNIEIVVDRLMVNLDIRNRLTDSIETALKAGNGTIIIVDNNSKQEIIFNENYACIDCGISYEEIEPRMFSFNSPYGACKACNGLGTTMEIDAELLVPDKERSLRRGAIEPWRRGGMRVVLYYRKMLRRLSKILNFDIDVPYKTLSKEVQKIIIYGDKDIGFEGVINNLQRRFKETESDFVKTQIRNYMNVSACNECNGARLRKESLSILINNKSIWDLEKMSIIKLKNFFDKLEFNKEKTVISKQILKEICSRIKFLINVGLGYLTLDRTSSTLSGGEAQRIRLATQIGAGLVGVLYVLDEPSIGLHQKDNIRLLNTLNALKNLGNTLIVVEHDETTIRKADYIIDLGPGAGEKGGEVVFSGKIKEILQCESSLTGKYLNGKLRIKVPLKRRRKTNKTLKIIKAAEYNLKEIDVSIPLGLLTCITGVSGSGKSTLIYEILYKTIARKLYGSKDRPGKHKNITGIEHIDKIIVVDQSPIGRTPRSNPATYVGLFTPIRELYSKIAEARVRGYSPGRFSFNVKGGRCDSCKGDGIKKIEMHFLPDVYVKCDLCYGKRYNTQTLDIKYKGKSISDVLEMTVDDALVLFENIPTIKSKLKVLQQVGLGYIKLGQSATTLSGGEAQRIKLVLELSKKNTGKTLYILDEPTTGLHFADIDKLLNVLQQLVDLGNTVLVIEHNMDVIKSADYIIDLGPEGGEKGGKIVALGTPEKVALNPNSFTGRYLQKVL